MGRERLAINEHHSLANCSGNLCYAGSSTGIQSKRKSIFYAGFIMGAGTSYCAFQGEGKISDDYRRGFMEALLQEGVNDPLINADKSVIFNVYEDIKDCD